MFEKLLQPIELGPSQISNRIFNPPHGTTLGHQGLVTDDLIAYHETRARGGVGLIILESMTVHPSYGFKDSFLYAGSDKIIPGMNRLAKACQQHATKVFGQLFHAGRAVRLSHDGSRPLTYSASDMPDERYRVIPVPMPNEMVWEMIDSYVEGASRLAEADLDGVEILASMGYLIAQFLNPATNHRDDEFGGSFENRLRFLDEIVTRCRNRIGDDKTLGIRITLDEKTDTGMDAAEVIKICQALDAAGKLDYFSVISGSSSSPGSWIHVFPPMAIPHAFVADDAARLKAAVSKPVLVAGRINQAQIGEAILADGKADMIGMARALIADPEFVNKVSSNRVDDIRACIGCNQACVGHRLAHHPISCIQNPKTGRELKFVETRIVKKPQSVVVIGAGPAGMKAALTAAQKGHRVTLFEKSGQLGGQVRLAEKLPGRAEFGGVTTNLVHQLQATSVEVLLDTSPSEARLKELDPDSIIIAVGAQSRLPGVDIDGVEVFDGWQVLRGEVSPGNRVVIADWSCDWNALGLAQRLALEGHHVRLLSGASVAGESIQAIVRDQWIGELNKLGVEMTPYARFYGAVEGSAFFQHMISAEPIVCDEVDSIVSCFAPRSVRDYDWLEQAVPGTAMRAKLFKVGDAMSPRSVEEAVLEGFSTAWNL